MKLGLRFSGEKEESNSRNKSIRKSCPALKIPFPQEQDNRSRSTHVVPFAEIVPPRRVNPVPEKDDTTRKISAYPTGKKLHAGRKLDGLGLSGNLNFGQLVAVVENEGGLVNLAGKILERARNFRHNLVALFKLSLAAIGGNLVLAGGQLGACRRSWLL